MKIVYNNYQEYMEQLRLLVRTASLDDLVDTVVSDRRVELRDILHLCGGIGRTDVFSRIEDFHAGMPSSFKGHDEWQFKWQFATGLRERIFQRDSVPDELLDCVAQLPPDISLEIVKIVENGAYNRPMQVSVERFALLVKKCGHAGEVAKWIAKAEQDLEGAKLDPDWSDMGDVNASFQKNGNLSAKQRRLDFLMAVQSTLNTTDVPKIRKGNRAPKP